MALPPGRVCFVSDGLSASVILPIARAFAHAGGRVFAMLGGRTHTSIILEEEFRSFSETVVVVTDDGTHGMRRYVVDALRNALTEAARPFDRVVIAAPLQTIYAATEVSRIFRTPILVGLHPLMVAGATLCNVGELDAPCGSCGVEVSGHPFSVCYDGPMVDGTSVDFAGLFERLAART
jgi:ferredoxin--NADP+ reductase